MSGQWMIPGLPGFPGSWATSTPPAVFVEARFRVVALHRNAQIVADPINQGFVASARNATIIAPARNAQIVATPRNRTAS